MVPDQPDAGGARCTRGPSRPPARARWGPDMHWLAAVERLRRERRAGRARHARRRCAGTRRATPGPRWSSPPTRRWGSIGGGNLEATAVDRARAMLAEARGRPGAARAGPQRQGAGRARPAVLRRRGDDPARTAGRRPVRRDLRRGSRRARAGPDPGPARRRAAPRRLPRATSSAGTGSRVLDDAVGAGARAPRAGPRAGAGPGAARAPTCSS